MKAVVVRQRRHIEQVEHERAERSVIIPIEQFAVKRELLCMRATQTISLA